MKTALYGRIFFGASAVLFGVIALMWHDLDTWQTLHSIWRLPLGSIVGACLMAAQIVGGIAMQHPRTSRLASIILGVVYLLFSLACVPSIIAASNLFERYGGSFFQQFSLLCGAIALYSATETDAAKAVRFGRLARIGLGVSAISFTLSQILYLRLTGDLVPKWIPPNEMFWAILTTIAFAPGGAGHSHQSPGTACNTPHDPHAGALRCLGLDSAPDRSSRGSFKLVRIRLDCPYCRRFLDGCRSAVSVISLSPDCHSYVERARRFA